MLFNVMPWFIFQIVAVIIEVLAREPLCFNVMLLFVLVIFVVMVDV